MGRFNGLACLVLIFLVQAIAAASRSEASDPYPLNNRTSPTTSEAKPLISSKASAGEGEGEESSSGSGVHEGADQMRRLGKHHASSDNKSVAGGGVIIGGLVTVAFAAVYCYIRVTRKKDGSLDHHPHQTAKL